jgi:deazaflavin-dependent oxidoreductase (nitroreductase family)
MQNLPKWQYRLMKIGPRNAYKLGLGFLIGRVVLLLTTIGRKSGLKRVTPLQYELVDGAYYLGSARGDKADWYRNILVDPRVEIQAGRLRFEGIAEPVADIERITDFLEYRLKQHPRFVGRVMRSEGVPANPTRDDIKAYAMNSGLVIVRSVED